MKRHSCPGKLIVIEGIDGSGKSTQAELLGAFLRDAGKNAHTTSEPTSGEIGTIIRERLAKKWESSNECLQLLFSADRLYHLEHEILPLLREGAWVVCDRYVFSTIAYGSATNTNTDWLLSLNSHAILPDCVFFLRVSPRTGLGRIEKNRAIVELFEEERTLCLVNQGYESVIEKFSEIAAIIDGEREIESVAGDMQSIIRRLFL